MSEIEEENKPAQTEGKADAEGAENSAQCAAPPPNAPRPEETGKPANRAAAGGQGAHKGGGLFKSVYKASCGRRQAQLIFDGLLVIVGGLQIALLWNQNTQIEIQSTQMTRQSEFLEKQTGDFAKQTNSIEGQLRAMREQNAEMVKQSDAARGQWEAAKAQTELIKEQIKQSDEGIELAKKANEVSAHAARAAQATVFSAKVANALTEHHARAELQPYIGADLDPRPLLTFQPSQDGGGTYRFELTMKNFGQTTAKGIVTRVDMVCVAGRNHKFIPAEDLEPTNGSGMSCAPGNTWGLEMKRSISRDAFRATHTVVFYGRINYTDSWGDERWTKFFFIKADNPKSTNVWEMRFANHDNETDNQPDGSTIFYDPEDRLKPIHGETPETDVRQNIVPVEPK